MNSNPVLAELVRSDCIENLHRGAFCLSDDEGKIIAAKGDVERRIFPRSAIKSMQALAMFTSGAAKKFNLDQRDIAIACASHHGEPDHIKAVKSLLEKIGCTVEDLQCGNHAPTNRKARNDLFALAAKPTAIHNNCSGKHAGMLAVAKALGAPTKDYWRAEHPVQQLVKKSIESLLGEKLHDQYCGTDGCSIPTYAAPLKDFARGFARMATGKGQDILAAGAISTIFEAATKNAFLIGGTDVFDSEAMEIFQGNLICKIGAEGVFCGALLNKGLGFALKCDDGNMLAAQVMLSSVLLEHGAPNPVQQQFLRDRQIKIIKNWRGLEVAIMSVARKSV